MDKISDIINSGKEIITEGRDLIRSGGGVVVENAKGVIVGGKELLNTIKDYNFNVIAEVAMKVETSFTRFYYMIAGTLFAFLFMIIIILCIIYKIKTAKKSKEKRVYHDIDQVIQELKALAKTNKKTV